MAIHASGIKPVDAIGHLALRGCHSVADLQLSGIFWQYGVEVAGGLRDAAGQQGRADRQSDRRAQHWIEYGIFAFVFLTAIATAMAAWYTRRQWESAVDNGHRQLRAYVFPEQANLVSSGKENQGAIALEPLGLLHHAVSLDLEDLQPSGGRMRFSAQLGCR